MADRMIEVTSPTDFAVAQHDGTSWPARPTAQVVRWVGGLTYPGAPPMLSYDEWRPPPPAIANIDTSLYAGDQTSLTVTDTDDSSGHTALAVSMGNIYNESPAAPTGWTRQGQASSRPFTASYMKAVCGYTLDAATSGDETFNLSSLSSAPRAGALVRMEGVGSLQNVRGENFGQNPNGNVTSTNGTWGTVSTTGQPSGDNEIPVEPGWFTVIVGVAWANSGAENWTLPSSWTRDLKSAGGAGSGTNIYVWSRTHDESGTIDPVLTRSTTTWTDAAWLAFTYGPAGM